MKKTILSLIVVFMTIYVSAQIQNTSDVLVCSSCVTGCTINQIYQQTEDIVYISPIDNKIAIVANNCQKHLGPLEIGVFITSDGAQTWAENYDVQVSFGDPTVSIDNNGQFYFGGLTNVNPKIPAFNFDGADLGNPSIWNYELIESDASGDKPHLWIDNYSGFDKIYCGYTRTYSTSTPNQQVVIKQSDINNFNTWSSEVKISDNISTTSVAHHGINIKTGPQGQIYSVWTIYDNPNTGTDRDEDGIGFAKLDASTFTVQLALRLPINIRGTRGTFGFTTFASMAVNQQNGHIYVAWTNIGTPGTNTGSNPDIYFIKSTDEGQNWSSPVMVNQDASNNQFYPTIACDPVKGVLAVGYLDGRNSPDLNYYVSLSDNEGQNWYDYQVSDNSFTGTFGIGNDYTSLDINNNYVIPVWNQNIIDPTCNLNYQNAITSAFSIACEDDIVKCNISENTAQLYRASNSITVAGNPSTCYYNILSGGGDIAFQAGNYIKFQDGFHSESGSLMHAYINTNCNLVRTFNGNANQRVSQNNKFLPFKKDKITNLKVYPNPTLNKVFVTFNLSREEHIFLSINDITSKEIVILDKSLPEGFYKSIIDLNDNSLKPGIYFLKLSTDSEIKSIKFVKMQ